MRHLAFGERVTRDFLNNFRYRRAFGEGRLETFQLLFRK